MLGFYANSTRRIILLLVAMSITFPCNSIAAPAKKPLVFENKFVRVRLLPRTPDQVAAFYEARGFPKQAIALIKSRCFITVGIRNKSKEILLHDLGTWSYKTKTASLPRIRRQDWFRQWDTMGIERPLQSTFRWTLLPESLDFRPEEGEGGNLTLVGTDEEFSISGSFTISSKTNSPVFNFTINNVHCAGGQK